MPFTSWITPLLNLTPKTQGWGGLLYITASGLKSYDKSSGGNFAGILQELGIGIYSCLWVKDCWGLCVSIILCSCSASSSRGLTTVWSSSSRDRLCAYLQGKLWAPGRWGSSSVKHWVPCLFTGRGHCSEQVQAADLVRGGTKFWVEHGCISKLGTEELLSLQTLAISSGKALSATTVCFRKRKSSLVISASWKLPGKNGFVLFVLCTDIVCSTSALDRQPLCKSPGFCMLCLRHQGLNLTDGTGNEFYHRQWWEMLNNLEWRVREAVDLCHKFSTQTEDFGFWAPVVKWGLA